MQVLLQGQIQRGEPVLQDLLQVRIQRWKPALDDASYKAHTRQHELVAVDHTRPGSYFPLMADLDNKRWESNE